MEGMGDLPDRRDERGLAIGVINVILVICMQKRLFDREQRGTSRKLGRMGRRRFRYVFFAVGLLLVFVCLVILHLDVIRGDFQRQAFGVLFGCLGGMMVFLSSPAWGMRVVGVAVALMLALYARVPREGLSGRLEKGSVGGQDAAVSSSSVVVKPALVSSSEGLQGKPDDEMYRDGDLDPLFRKLADRKDNGGVAGIWMRGGDERKAEVIGAFLKRMSQTRETPEYHGRQGGGLFIVDKSPLSFDELARIVSRIGTLELSDSSLHFMDVELDRNLFEESAPAKVLNNPDDPFYLEANLRELRNLDARRVAAAARRLALAPPAKPSIGVCAVLSERLREPWGNDAEYVAALASALGVWAPPDDENTRLLLAYTVDSLMRANLSVPVPAVDYLLARRDGKSVDFLLALWRMNPEQWETRCMLAGNNLERGILGVIEKDDTPSAVRESGVRILGKVGGNLSLPLLREYGRNEDSRLSTFAHLAQEEIERRLHS